MWGYQLCCRQLRIRSRMRFLHQAQKISCTRRKLKKIWRGKMIVGYHWAQYVCVTWSTEWRRSCRSLSAKEPILIGLLCRKWPIKIGCSINFRHPMKTNAYSQNFKNGAITQSGISMVDWSHSPRFPPRLQICYFLYLNSSCFKLPRVNSLVAIPLIFKISPNIYCFCFKFI